MTKVIGPIHSDSASGGLGDALTFSTRRGYNLVRYQRKQKDVITPDRTAQRFKFLQGLILWRSLPSVERYYWSEVEKHGFVEI